MADSSGDGNLDLMELKECLTKAVGGFTVDELFAIIAYIDENGDGDIDKAEFLG